MIVFGSPVWDSSQGVTGRRRAPKAPVRRDIAEAAEGRPGAA